MTAEHTRPESGTGGAAPEITYDATTALVVVDVQNDFADPRGSLSVRFGEEVVPLVNAQVAAADRAGSTVVYTQDWHPPQTPHFAQDGGVWPVHCVRETWGAQLHPALDVRGEVVRKGVDGEDGYSGFSVRDPVSGTQAPTRLASLLPRQARRLVVVGIAGDYCVKETVLDARRLGYDVVVPLALTRFVNLQPGDDEQAVAEMRQAGADIV